MSLDYFCSDDYVDSLVNFIEEIDTTHYYVHMGVAWLMATLYCKCKDKFTPYLHTIKLDSKTYNKGLTKIRESLIPTKEEKAYIKTLKRQD